MNAFEPVRTATVGGHVVTLLPRAGYETGYVPTSGVVGFAFESQRGEHAFAGERRQPFLAYPNTLSWVPPGCDVWSRSATGGEYLTIVSSAPGAAGGASTRGVPMDGLGGGGADEALADGCAERFNDRRDARARRAANAIRTCLLSDDDAPWALEEAVLALRACVGELLGVAGEPGATATWLTPARLSRVDEWIEAHLAERTSVSDLAAELGLSAGFLTRAMRAATGRSPHDYLVDRRVARARALLRDSGRPIADIALDCGFASHSHLGAALRSRLGVTPSALRASG